MNLAANFIIGLFPFCTLLMLDAPMWAAAGFGMTAAFVFSAADYVIEKIKGEK